jgi:hypothetical protein
MRGDGLVRLHELFEQRMAEGEHLDLPVPRLPLLAEATRPVVTTQCVDEVGALGQQECRVLVDQRRRVAQRASSRTERHLPAPIELKMDPEVITPNATLSAIRMTARISSV